MTSNNGVTNLSPKASTPAVVPAPMPVKIGGRQARHLAQAIQLEESGTSPLIRFSLFLTTAMCLLFIVWAALTEVPEIAAAEGSVIPDGQVVIVQHLEGGIGGIRVAPGGGLGNNRPEPTHCHGLRLTPADVPADDAVD